MRLFFFLWKITDFLVLVNTNLLGRELKRQISLVAGQLRDFILVRYHLTARDTTEFNF